jgi:hypothetical protein
MKCKLKENQIYKNKNTDRQITNNFYEVQIKKKIKYTRSKIQIAR